MRPRLIHRGDVDGFFGLFVDNLLQLMLITVLCPTVCGLPLALVVERILPGAAISILLGNLFYSWQARRLAIATGRDDVTALPYGINTPSLLAYIFLVMGPVYRETLNPDLAWKAGLFACLGSALVEGGGAFIGGWLRRHTPRAALLSALAGIAITFISMNFVFQIFAAPLIAIVPTLLILFVYAGRIRLPLGLPGGFVAVLLGTGIAWVLKALGLSSFTPSTNPYIFGFRLPAFSITAMLAFVRNGQGLAFLSVIVPMGLFNLIGSLQNLESAEAAGDRYGTRSSLLANGLGSLVAALCGSPFPTTIYIGHPGWKTMGARWGYSILNGVTIAGLCLIGGVTLVLRVVPIEAMLGILVWIGIVITAQAFTQTPQRHALAVAVGIVPALAAWVQVIVETSVRISGSSFASAVPRFGGDLYVHGLLALSQGFLLSSMLLSAILAFVIDGRFLRAAAWSAASALLADFGLIHGYRITASGALHAIGFGAARSYALAYLATALVLVALRAVSKKPRSFLG
jgi:AGZA family xanthine/uracil permease-like MFS transporter